MTWGLVLEISKFIQGATLSKARRSEPSSIRIVANVTYRLGTQSSVLDPEERQETGEETRPSGFDAMPINFNSLADHSGIMKATVTTNSMLGTWKSWFTWRSDFKGASFVQKSLLGSNNASTLRFTSHPQSYLLSMELRCSRDVSRMRWHRKSLLLYWLLFFN